MVKYYSCEKKSLLKQCIAFEMLFVRNAAVDCKNVSMPIVARIMLFADDDDEEKPQQVASTAKKTSLLFLLYNIT